MCTALKTYVERHEDVPPVEWARRFGISRSHFVMIRDGNARPSTKLMEKIAQETNGEVPILSWFERAAE